MSRHNERLVAELKRLAAEFLQRVAGPQSMITVTDCLLSADGQHATILFSVLPEERERAALGFAQRQRGDFVRYVHEHLRAGHLPQVRFALDEGEKHRQKIDKLLQPRQSGDVGEPTETSA